MTEDRHEIADGLREYAAPSTPPAGGTQRVLAALDRRRRRRAVGASVVAAVVVVAGLGIGLGAVRGDRGSRERPADRTVASDTSTAPARWVDIPASPLTPRYGSVGAWTGSELVVVGGSTGAPCPPGADCALPDDSSYQRDGAAYDPETDTWRTIADAPERFERAEAVWSRSEVVVSADTGTWAYDPESDAWRVLDDRPGPSVDEVSTAPPVVTDAGIVFPAYDQGSGATSPDVLLDPVSGAWTRLPRDPFGESYDRSLAWDGERLWLLSMSVDEHFGASRGAPSRLAVLDGGLVDGTWRVVEETTPDLTYGQLLWWSGDRLVVTPALDRAGQVYDADAGSWTPVPPVEGDEGCSVPPVGAGDSWIAGGGPALVSTDESAATVVLPPCPDLSAPDVAVWAGDDLLVWGGPNADSSAGTTTGYRSEPAAPAEQSEPTQRPVVGDDACPAVLPYGEGYTVGPATEEPDLPRLGVAWVCVYDDPAFDSEWVLRDPSVPVEDPSDLAALNRDLGGLRVPRGEDGVGPPTLEGACVANAGPRYVLSYLVGDRFVGVVVDAFGCGHAALSDDLFTTAPGTSATAGIPPGVLESPDGLVALLSRLQEAPG